MQFAKSPLKPILISNLSWGDRWTVGRRLQELQIECACGANHSLKVHLTSPLSVIQLWSVLKHTQSSRQSLVQWLDSCWHYSLENSP